MTGWRRSERGPCTDLALRTNMAHSTLVHAGGRTMHGRDLCAAILRTRGSRGKAARQLHE